MAKSGMKSLTLSKEAKKAGVKWMMMDGVKNAKEARRLEKIFVRGLKNIKPEDVAKGYEKINCLRAKMGLSPIKVKNKSKIFCPHQQR